MPFACLSLAHRVVRASHVAAALVLVAVTAVPSWAQSKVTAAELESYRLTTPNVEKLVPVARNLKALETDEEVVRWVAEQRAKSDQEEETAPATDRYSGVAMVNRMITLSGQPKVRRAVESAGISVRDYALTMVAMPTSVTIVSREQQSGAKANTAEMAKNLTGAQLDNANLVRANWTRVMTLMTEVEKYKLKEP